MFFSSRSTECYDSGSVRFVTLLNENLMPTDRMLYYESGVLDTHTVYYLNGYRKKVVKYNEDGSVRVTTEYDENGNGI